MFHDPIRLLICDLDGTLLDSFRDIVTSCNLLLKERGAAPLSDAAVRPCIGRGVQYLVENVLLAAGVAPAQGGAEVGHVATDGHARNGLVAYERTEDFHAADSGLELAVARYREIYHAHALCETRLYPGVSDTLATLRRRPGGGPLLAVISNKPEQATKVLLEAFGIAGHFSVIAGGDTFDEMKPSPLPLQRVMDRIGCEVSQTAIVGDSVYDIVAGREAGVITIAATYGFQPHEMLKALEPDFTVSAFSDILQII